MASSKQFDTPQVIYDRPASMYVADFIGSPPMNFIRFNAGLPKGARIAGSARRMCDAGAARLTWRRANSRSGSGPSKCAFSDTSPLRGAIYGSEYLGTTQIVTIETRGGRVRARLPAENTATPLASRSVLVFASERLSLFDCVRAGRPVGPA